MSDFGLQKRKKDGDWWDYDYGESDWTAGISYNGLIKKSIQEKKTLYEDKEYDFDLQNVEHLDKFLEQNDLHKILVCKDADTYRILTVREDTCLYVCKYKRDQNAKLTFLTTNLEFREAFIKFYESYGVEEIPPDYEPKPIYMMMEDDGAYYIEEQGEIHVPLNRSLYSQDALVAFDKCVADLKSDVPNGRITIFDGPPGTGKTYLIRGLITELGTECAFIVVPPSLVAKIGEPAFTSALMRKKRSLGSKPAVLILEDADQLVSARLRETMDSISSALNMGDGILGDVFNIRLVITTNQPIINIDPALLRPGRISAHVTVKELTKQEAMSAINSISETSVRDLPKDHYTLAEAFQYCRDNKIETITESTRNHKKVKKTLGRRKATPVSDY